MKTTFPARTVWLVILVAAVFFGCAKKSDTNNNGPGMYGYGGYPGGGYGGAGGVGTISAAGYVNIPGDCGGNQNIDFELYISVGSTGVPGPGTTTMGNTVNGQIRMAQSDCICGINVSPNSVMPVVPAQSQITLTGSPTFQTITGRIAVQNPYGGIFNIGIAQARLEARAQGTLIGRISNSQFQYVLIGSVQPGMCTMVDPGFNWSFDPM